MALDDGRLLDVNPALCRMLGYTREQLLSRTYLDLTHPDDHARELEQVASLNAGDQSSYTIEKRYLRADGSSLWVRVTSSLAQDRAERRYRISVIQDIDERMQAEAARRQSETRLAAFMQNSPGSLFMKDAEGRFVVVNGAFLSSMGKTADEVIGRTDAELFPPELAQRFVAEDREVIVAGQPRQFEDTFEHNSRKWTFLSQKFPLPNGAVGCVATDITEHKQAEAALQESQRRFRTIVEALPGFAWTADERGAIDYVSRRWTEYSGADLEQTKAENWQTFVHPDDVEQARSTWAVSVVR